VEEASLDEGLSELNEEWKDLNLLKKYRRIIADTIDEALEGILGKTIKEIVYAYMRHEYNLDRDSCYKDVEKFIKALRDVIGMNASLLIENIVVKRLCESLSLHDVNEDASLVDFVEKLKSLKLKVT